MPIYEYICMKCSEKFSLLRKMNADEHGVECPKCSSSHTKKLMSSFCCSSGGDAGFSSAPSHGFGGGGG